MSSAKSGNFVDGLQEAIRQNPVSAALVGVGLLWMFTGGNRLTAAAAVLGPAAKSVASGALSGVQHSVDAVGSAGGSVRAMGARASDSVQETLSDAASIVGNAASRAYESAKDGMSSTLQSTSGNVPPGELLQAWDGALLQNSEAHIGAAAASTWRDGPRNRSWNGGRVSDHAKGAGLRRRGCRRGDSAGKGYCIVHGRKTLRRCLSNIGRRQAGSSNPGAHHTGCQRWSSSDWRQGQVCRKCCRREAALQLLELIVRSPATPVPRLR